MRGQGLGYRVQGRKKQLLFQALTTSYLLLATLVLPLSAWAITPGEIGKKACEANPDALGCNGSTLFGSGSIFNNIVNVIIFVVGALSVFMIVIGGLRYVLSGGDSAGVKSAKDTILYALVGVGVAIFAWTIVTFVIGKVG